MQTKTLFSPYYLDTRLADQPEWAEDVQPVFATIQTLWQKASQYGPAWNEAQTEEEFVKPVLAALGWSFIVQAKSSKQGQLTRPDYALFATEANRDAAYPHQGHDEAFYSQVLAIGEAKYWGRPLSQKDSSGRDTWKAGSNPSHQMVSYLVGTGVAWGILTNGQVWRLYSREVSSTASEFYEVDLTTIFAPLSPPGRGGGGEGLDDFKRFWLFFRRNAFTPDAHGQSFVQRIHEGSATYARQISDKLKELVFAEVMPEIAGGFVAYRYQQLGQPVETEASLGQIYQASLSLLYKLLFLLYAEARGLLPMSNPGYRQKSLTELARWAAEQLDRKLPLSTATHATDKYAALLALFSRVDQGDPSLGIPRYNGGLFNPATPENQFLAGHKLSDWAVVRAVDTLVRDAGQPVDYAYISVRNLGAIYEGLLENKLRVVDAAKGQVELINDKGERKASGSYYTPDYIVKYIVQHTLEPILAERDGQFQAAMDRCADLRRQLAHTADPAANRLRRGQLEQAEREAREAFLGIKVLDPAIGSGHFLVNAVDDLTDGIILRLQAYHDARPDVPWAWNPIQQLIETVRQQILTEMDRQGIGMEPARLDDTALLTRLVMKRCIYGVDLNPMAVELAKLSLWLHSFTVGAPLSFLDHHLRWGNSLIGSDVRTVEQAIQVTASGQLGLFAGPFAGLLDLTSLMTEVAEQADATLADVHHSAGVFDQFQQELTPYKQALDLWVSQSFGNAPAKEFLTLHGAEVLPALRGQQPVAETYQAAIQQARELWRTKRFFHWDLEFPEVFVDLRRRDWAENPGFDAVIGNPPYVNVLNIDTADREYLLENYKTAIGRVDVYIPLFERALSILRDEGICGLIIPNKYFVYGYGRVLRGELIRRTSILSLVDLARAPSVFPEAATYTVITIVQKRIPTPDQSIDAVVFLQDDPDHLLKLNEGQSKEVLVREPIPQMRFTSTPENVFSLWLYDKNWEIYEKVSLKSILVGDQFQLEQCIRIGSQKLREELIVPPGQENIVPNSLKPRMRRIIDAEEVEKYFVNWQGRYLIYDADKLYNPKTETLFEQPKILIKDTSAHLIVGLDLAEKKEDVFYALNTVYILVPNEGAELDVRFLASILNAPIGDFLYRLLFGALTIRGGYIRFREYIQYLPIPRITFTTPSDERTRLAAEGQGLAETFIAGPQPLSRAAYTGSALYAFLAARLATGADLNLIKDSQTDVIHDLLAGLAEQMIVLNKQKQGHLQGFRLDLAGYLNEKQLVKLNRLYTPKKPPAAGVKNYEQKLAEHQTTVKLAQAQLQDLAGATLDLDDFWRLNSAQWIWLLRQNLGQVANMSSLVGVYQTYHTQLAPLMRRLRRMDWLIDQIVYQLYGLTEEEIKVVER